MLSFIVRCQCRNFKNQKAIQLNLNIFSILIFNPFHDITLFLYPVKTSKTFWFPHVLGAYRKRLLA